MKELIEKYSRKLYYLVDKQGYISSLEAEDYFKRFLKDVYEQVDTVLSLNEDDIDRGQGHCTYVRQLLKEEFES